MASRRDQLQSYQFLTQRVISAFVMRETDPAQSPLRRGVGAVFAGLMIAVMVAAGFGVAGILTKSGNSNWKSDGSVVVEKETGASYLFSNGQLNPMLNYTSALLASGQSTPTVYREPSNSLAGTPRGQTLGIAGAPDSLPGTGKRVGLPWTLCTVGSPGGGSSTTVTLLIGGSASGGRPLGDQGLVVVNPSGDERYLIWHNRRYLLRSPTVVIPALFGAVNPLPVGTAWLNGLPEGLDIGSIVTGSQTGSPSSAVPGRNIGDLVSVQTATRVQYFIVFNDGLAVIDELQKDIYAAQSTSVHIIPLTPGDMTRAPVSHQVQVPSGQNAPPETPPALGQATSGQPLCAASHNPSTLPDVSVGGTITAAGPGIATGSAADTGTSLADRIVVPGGRIAVVRAVQTPGASTGALFLVTDSGLRYSVPSEEVLQTLGYPASAAIDVLASLVSRIPAGPALDPAAATRPVSANGS
jgi:type VII secretion protein EccB